MRQTILLINGPNLNLLGRRNPELYGNVTLDEIVNRMTEECDDHNYTLVAFQSNSEGSIIDWVQRSVDESEIKFVGIVLNAGGLTHTSVSLRDAVEYARDMGVPTVEVHLSNIYEREGFRRSLLTEVCAAIFCGKGVESYSEGFNFLFKQLAVARKPG